MIFRLSQKLNAKIKAGTLRALALHENPLADWSAHLFQLYHRHPSTSASIIASVISPAGSRKTTPSALPR